jgi:hypothetical protein
MSMKTKSEIREAMQEAVELVRTNCEALLAHCDDLDTHLGTLEDGEGEPIPSRAGLLPGAPWPGTPTKARKAAGVADAAVDYFWRLMDSNASHGTGVRECPSFKGSKPQ